MGDATVDKWPPPLLFSPLSLSLSLAGNQLDSQQRRQTLSPTGRKYPDVFTIPCEKKKKNLSLSLYRTDAELLLLFVVLNSPKSACGLVSFSFSLERVVYEQSLQSK